MFTEHARECQQYTDYYLWKKHKCDLKDCIETYFLDFFLIALLLQKWTPVSLKYCCIYFSIDVSRILKTLTQAKKTKQQKNTLSKWQAKWEAKSWPKQSGGLMYSQLHYEVQVVWALIDVLQSHYILMLYPAEGEKKIHFACCQLLFISAQATNEV